LQHAHGPGGLARRNNFKSGVGYGQPRKFQNFPYRIPLGYKEVLQENFHVRNLSNIIRGHLNIATTENFMLGVQQSGRKNHEYS
jgi:hypothetical protein